MYKPFAKLLYGLSTRLRGEDVGRYLTEYLKTQTFAGENLRTYQLRLVRKQIAWACERVPFYRALCAKEGLGPESLRTLDDLKAFPIITKSDIRDNSALFRARDFGGRVYAETTGGSLGVPLSVLKDAENLARKRAAAWRFYGWYGVEPADRQARFWGLPLYPRLRRREILKDAVANRIRLNAFELNDDAYAKFYKKVRKNRIDFVYGYASTIYNFADFILRNELENPFPVAKVVVMTAETVYPAQREVVREAFGAPTAVEYGSGETGVVAFECPEGTLHVNADNLILEVVDGATTVTELHSKAMPLIRYRLGDSAAFSGDLCDCGCGFPALEYVAGRESDMLEVAGKRVHCQALNYIFTGMSSLGGSVRQFQVVQSAADGSIAVYIVPGGSYTPNTGRTVERIIRERIGYEGPVTITTVDEINPDPSGKLRYFVRK